MKKNSCLWKCPVHNFSRHENCQSQLKIWNCTCEEANSMCGHVLLVPRDEKPVAWYKCRYFTCEIGHVLCAHFFMWKKPITWENVLFPVTHFSHNEILATSTRTCENLWFTSKEARFMWSNAPCFITTCKNSDPQPITYKLHAWKCKFHPKFKLNIKISHWNYDFMCEKANFTWEDSQAHCVFLLI